MPVPFAVHHHPAHRLVVVRFTGAVTGEDVLGAIEGILAGPWAPDGATLADARAATSFRLTTEDIERVLAMVARVNPVGRGGKTAFLVRGDQGEAVARRLIRETEHVTDRARRVHYTAAAAAEWLGVPVELLEGP